MVDLLYRFVHAIIGVRAYHSCLLLRLFLFFKPKTADEMRISDWSSDVCSSDRASAFFALPLPQVRAIIKEVAVVTATWRDTAKTVGARSAEITRMASAFAHSDLTRALAL